MIHIARRGALLLSLVLILSACSDDGERVETSDSRTTTAEETTTTTEAPTTTTLAPTTTPPTVAPAAAPTPTTAKPKPTTTTTTIPADHAAVTIVNEYPAAAIVTIQGVRHDIPRGGRKGPFAVKPKAVDGNDTITITRADDQSCGLGGAGDWFTDGGKHELKVYADATTGCGNVAAGPGIRGVVNPGNKGV